MARNDNMLLITDVEGYSPELSRLVSMMYYIRFVTLESVKNLSVARLDYQIDEKSNSIGSLLKHIAATEYFFQSLTFEKRELNDMEIEKWKSALQLGESGRKNIRGNNLEYYLDILNRTRAQTLDIFKTKNDDWLYEVIPFWNNKPSNNYFFWFHVFEDEINHRGQINWLKKRIPENL